MTRLAWLLFLLPLPVFSGTANVAWTPPTLYTDASPLPSGDIASTTVEYGSCAGTAFGTKAGQVVATGAASMLSVLNLAPGIYCFRAFVTITAAKGGLSSANSNTATGAVPFPTPGAPSSVTVTIQ